MYEEFDRENMFGAIWNFPENLVDALKLGNQITLSQSYINIQNIVVAGMGGSAIGGDVVSILEKDNLDIPFVVCRGYSLPNWVNEIPWLCANPIQEMQKKPYRHWMML